LSQNLKGSKEPPDRDAKYLVFVRSQPCLICKRPGSTAHHQPERRKGTMGGKTSDYRAVPLCFDHHNEGGTELQPGSYDNLSWDLWRRYEIDIEDVIARLSLEYFFV
jgi:hypothetical protein